MYRLNAIQHRLSIHRPATFELREFTRQAAVAIILRETPEDTEVLFIQRAERRGDPWSGHMAFPGGHRDPVDANLRAAAERETFEEIGLDLGSGRHLGTLDQQRAMPRGRALSMLIEPHVFAIDGEPAFTPNYEVAEVVWTSLSELGRGERHHIETRPIAGTPTPFNGYRLARGHFVWGLTYRMLKSFFSVLDPDWRPPPEL